MRVTVTVCDVCGKTDRPTKVYQVQEGVRKRAPDLCAEHGAPLEALLDLRPKATVKKAPAAKKAAASGRKPRVTTMEEIEAQKKRRPAKKS